MNAYNHVHLKWPIYQEFLTHLADLFCMCMYTNVLSKAKMAQLSGMFIYPVVHVECTVFKRKLKLFWLDLWYEN